MNLTLPLGCTLLLLLSAPLGSCSRSNPLFCDRDTPCDLEERSFCDVDKVFPDTTLENECIARPNPVACNRAQPCEDGVNSTCTNDSDGVCVQCTEATHCTDPAASYCDPRNNECTDDVIVACDPGEPGDTQCASLSDGALAYCSDEQVCVACLANEHCTENVAEAVCDRDSFTCRGCEENSECDSRLCGEGICAEETAIVYVDAEEGSDGVSCGTLIAPCATIEAGLGQTTPTRDTVLIAEGTYEERIEFVNKTAHLIGEDKVLVRSNLLLSENLLRAEGTSQAIIENIELLVLSAPDTSDAVLCNSAAAALTLRNVVVHGSEAQGIVGLNCALAIIGSTIRDNTGVGVEVDGGTLTLHSSQLSHNGGGGTDINNANYSLVNNIIAQNGGPVTLFGGVRIESTSLRTEEFSFNTIAQNSRLSAGVTGSALRCEATSVVATNNIFMLASDSSTPLVSGCATQFSLFDTADTMPTGLGNVSADAEFANASDGDFHLEGKSPGIDEADPGATLETDIDGEPRPVGEGSDMGADEVQ